MGIDVSKSSLDIYLRPSSKQFQVPNQASGIAGLIEQLQPFEIAQVILEASGGLELDAAQALQEQGFAVSIINPRQGRDFAKASGKLAKTDRIDASVLAHFGQAMQPAVTVLSSVNEQALQEAVTRRRQLVETLTAEKNRQGKMGERCGRTLMPISNSWRNALGNLIVKSNSSVNHKPNGNRGLPYSRVCQESAR